MSIFRLASGLFMAGAIFVTTGCPGDDLKKKEEPLPPGTIGAKCTTDADCYSGDCVNGKCVASNNPLTVDEVCAMYISASINTDTSNGPGLCQQNTMGNAQTMDAGMISYYCRPGTSARLWATRFMTAVDEGRLGVDWSKARQCLSETRFMRATIPGVELLAGTEWTALQEGLCQEFYNGTLSQGAACKEDWDCPKGMGCYSDQPTTPNSSFCMARAPDGADCSLDFHACAEGLYCNREGKCAAQLPNNRDCMFDDDCQSGYCEYDSGTCRPVPYKLLGEACSRPNYAEGEENPCGEFCVTCRRTVAGGQAMCLYSGKAGDYCEDWMDCAYDLGCVNNVCGTAGVGQACACGSSLYCVPQIESLCAPGLYCIPPLDCWDYDGDETACNANAAFCHWDAEYEYCDRAQGSCVPLPPSGECFDTGDSFYGPVCDPAAGVYCNTDNNTCVPFGEQDAPCSDTEYCNENHGLYCVNDQCARVCEVIDDCSPGQFCETETESGIPTCLPINMSECFGNYACPKDDYCDFPGTQCYYQYTENSTCIADTECAWYILGDCVNNRGCEALATQGPCEGNTACLWDPLDEPMCASDCFAITDGTDCGANQNCFFDDYYGCMPACWNFDYDETGCGGLPNCEWSPADEYCNSRCDALSANQAACDGTGYCDYYTGFCGPRTDCTQWIDDGPGCAGAPNGDCTFTETDYYCDTRDPEAPGVCADKLAVGAPVIPDNIGFAGPVPSDDAAACVNGYAIWVGPGDYDYACSVKPNPPIDYTGCLTSVNDTTHALINLVFVFGGVLFLRRRFSR